MEKKELTYIDLFAGCGGLSLGLHNAGWKGIFAIEKSADAFETLKHNLILKRNHYNWPSWLKQRPYDIKYFLDRYSKELSSLKGAVDMVTGGPPCQGFSSNGKRNEADKRNKLIEDYLKFIEIVMPKVLFFENVKGFTREFIKNKTKGKKYSSYVIQRLQELGYDVCGDIVDFSEYGVPQKRNRFILVGVLNTLENINAEFFFDKIKADKGAFLISKNLNINTNLQEAISDLLMENGKFPSPDTNNFEAGIYSEPRSNYQLYSRQGISVGMIADSHRFVNHKIHIIERFLYILKNEVRNKPISEETKLKLGLKKRTQIPLDSKKPTPTITTLPDDYIHYCEPRILTVREYARIQSFPDWYEFQGKYTTGGKRRVLEVPRYTQIGNAIPPLFGEQSGLVLKNILSK
jgi:DNA (cytosine-5)-methyltransferase 1